MFVTLEQRGRILSKIFITAWLLFCIRVAAAEAVGAPNVRKDFASVENWRYRKDVNESPTNFQRILPVQVDFGSLVNAINHRILGMEGNVSYLSEQMQIVEETLKQQLESCKDSKAGVEKQLQIEKQKQNSLKKEVSGLKERLEVEKENFKNISHKQNSLQKEISQLKEQLKSFEEQKLQTTAEPYSAGRKFEYGFGKSWEDARTYCKSKGGDLASHLDKRDLEFIFSKAIPDGVSLHARVGGHMNTQANAESNLAESWEWVDGVKIPSDDGNWQSGYKHRLSLNFRCLYVHRGPFERQDGTKGPAFMINGCESKSTYLCEIF